MAAQNEIDILPDLKKLLRESINDQVIVVDCQTSSLLPPGENYASLMYKVEATIKRTKNSPEEKLQLVAKTVAMGEFQKSVMKNTVIFKKEIFVYKRLAAFYKQIEKETKLGKEENLIDLFPKFYGSQLTRNEKNSDEADDHAMILMENLKVLGYDIMDRKNGLDLEHAKEAITELARYHALGIALKTHKPALFEEVRKNISEKPFDIPEYHKVMNHLVELITKDPRICKYIDRIKATFEGNTSWWDSFNEFEAVEPWVSINHGDFWVNNMMFQHDKNGISGIKFLDFQIARVCSPIYDIPYFLCGSTSSYVLDNHLDELLDIYYNRFIEVLNKINCDSLLFTRASFDEQMKKISYRVLINNILAVKFFTLKVLDDTDMNDIQSSVMLSGANKLFFDRTWNIVKMYIGKGWL